MRAGLLAILVAVIVAGISVTATYQPDSAGSDAIGVQSQR
jgi:hypothetical protein